MYKKMSAIPPLNISVELGVEKNLEHFVRELSRKFIFGGRDEVMQFTNEYWGTDFRNLKLEDMLFKGSRSSSVCSTPRLGPSTANAFELDTLGSKLTSLSSGVKRVRGGPNKCIFKLKSGERKNQECGKSCVGDYCATHMKCAGIAQSVAQGSTQNSLLAPSAAFGANGAGADADEVPTKRKMQKKPPVPLNTIDQYIASHVQTFQVHRKNGVLVHLQTGFVYDDEKQAIYGHTSDEGVTIKALTKDNIEHIKQLNMKHYELPPNLASDADGESKAVHVELELEDDDDMYEAISGDEQE